MNLSFAGCGFLGIYHVGVACCFRKYAPHLLLDKISGASAGAIAACCLICDLPIGKKFDDRISNIIIRNSLSADKDSCHPSIYSLVGLQRVEYCCYKCSNYASNIQIDTNIFYLP